MCGIKGKREKETEMEKEMTILYEVHDNLYVNLTNRCPCACTFCLRQTMDEMNHSGSLWLKREPTVEEEIGRAHV